MAISNTSILIKRSTATGTPGSLKAGEIAYSYLSNTLFMGNSTGTGVVNIGGLLYTQTLDAATTSNTASTLVKRDVNGAFSGQLYGNANTSTALKTAQNFSISGGDISAGTVAFDGTGAVVLNASLNSITGLSAGTYGSATAIPVVTVAANGRVTAVSTSAINTSFNISDGTTSNTINGGATFFQKGTGGITTTVSANTVTFSTDNTVLRSNTPTVGLQTVSTDLTIAGNLIVTGTQTYVNTNTVQTNDSLLELAANNTTGDVVDIGFYGASNTGAATVYHGLVREGSGGSAAGNFYLFKNLATNPTGNTVNYAGLSRGSLIADLSLASGYPAANLTGVLGVSQGGTGTTTSTGTGSVVLSQSPTFSGTANFTSINTASIAVGTTTFVGTNVLGSFSANNNSYEQFIIQNANTGSQASVDFIVNNDKSTDTTFYGDFGMNSSGFSGSGSLSLPNAVYLYSANSDLSIGTNSANAIHFVVNNGSTDAMTISSSGVVSLGTALPVSSGGTGATSFSVGQVVVGNGTGALQTIANSSFTVTGSSNLANNTVTSVTVDAYGRTTALTYSAISGLTIGQGGTGATSFTTNGIVFGGSSLSSTVAAGTSDQTWSNQILTVTNAGVPVWSSAMDGGTF